jgi:hypothetical protein
MLQPDRPMAAETGAQPATSPPQARPRRDAEATADPGLKSVAEAMLDPLFCQLAVNQGPGSFVQTDSAVRVADAALPLREDLQNLLTGLARRAAWGGERRRGSAKIELSEGAWAGASLVVHTDQRSVSVELELPAGAAAPGLEQRIAERLEARGFAARVRVR